MIKILIILLILSSHVIFAVENNKLKANTQFCKNNKFLTLNQCQLVKGIIDELVTTSHPNLNKKNIKFEIKELKHRYDLLQSNFNFVECIIKNKNVYRVHLSKKLFTLNISRNGLMGIMAHELVHTEDYASGGVLGGILPAGRKYLLNRIQYERKTDLRTILKGHGKNLISFKEFQYPLLSEAGLKLKQLRYITPKEIEYIMALGDKFEKYTTYWLKHQIPKSLTQLKAFDWFMKNPIQLKRQKYDIRQMGKVPRIINLKTSSDFKGTTINIIPIINKSVLNFNDSQTVRVKNGHLKMFFDRSSDFGYLVFDDELNYIDVLKIK